MPREGCSLAPTSRALGAAVLMMVAAGGLCGHPQARAQGLNAATGFGAWTTDNNWEEVVGFDDVHFRDSYLVGLALSREIAGGRSWAVEIEGQAVKHFGEQQHWEFNGAVLARWRDFPWNARLPTSAAIGIGPSYATETPPVEVDRKGASNRFLIYWTAELGLPQSPVTAIVRLHHRSKGFGLVADEGGSNAIAVGLRRRF